MFLTFRGGGGGGSEMYLRGKSVRSWCYGSFIVDPLSYFLFEPVFHDLCNKGRGMCYPLLLIVQRSPCSGGSGFPLSLSEWSLAHMSDGI